MVRTWVFAIVLFLIALAIPNQQTSASYPIEDQIDIRLERFINQNYTGTYGFPIGVYVEGKFLYHIEPQFYADHVTENPHAVSLFGMAAENNVIGLLAHDYLAGAKFDDLAVGEKISIIYSDATVDEYPITRIDRYRLLYFYYDYQWQLVYENLDALEYLTEGELFAKEYDGLRHVTLQTCLTQDGNPYWGRLFVIAEK